MSARRARSLGGALFAALLAQFCNSAFAGPARAAPPFTTEVERCLLPAAEFHGVNVYVLRVILRVESGLNPTAVARNANGSKDVGIGQMNSIHFKELGRYGPSVRFV